jgi:5-methylcytosine-specific restriction endonuclease McrA
MLNEWYETKLRAQEVERWVSRFSSASGNKDEWAKVHQDYLRSKIWAELRKKALARANSRCEDCRVLVVDDSVLDVHHLNYNRVGGNEKMEDLQVLCSACHKKAHEKRDRETDERRKNALYQRRLDGFGSKEYGPGWRYDQDEQKVEIEFILWLYKKHCKENGLYFDPQLDTEIDEEFLEFWDLVIDGDD